MSKGKWIGYTTYVKRLFFIEPKHDKAIKKIVRRGDFKSENEVVRYCLSEQLRDDMPPEEKET